MSKARFGPDVIEAAQRIVAFNPLDGDWDDEMCEAAMLVSRAFLDAVEGEGNTRLSGRDEPTPCGCTYAPDELKR